MKKTIAIVVAFVAIIGGFLYLTKPANKASSTSAQPTNHVMGSGTSGVTLTEYGDYQCPGCKAYYPVAKQLTTDYGDKIKFQFRNFPLETLHQNARAGARAAEAADMQGKYWEMHDQLYENQDDWKAASDPLSFYKTYAQSVGVKDMAKFESDYKSAAVNDRINADIQEGNKVPVTQTPTFLINGKKIDTPTSYEAFKAVIDSAIASQTAQPAKDK